MRSTLNHPNSKSFLNKKKFINRLIIAFMSAQLAFVGLVGCDRSNNSESKSDVQILTDKVIIDKSLIHTNTPEQYKPTYNFDGKLIPVNHSDITLPKDLSSKLIKSEVLVKVGDVVEEGQIIAEYVVAIDENKAKALANEFTEVYINGERYEEESEVSQVTSAALSTIGIYNTNDEDDKSTETQSTPTNINEYATGNTTRTDNDLNVKSNKASNVESKASTDATSSKINNLTQQDELAVTLIYKSAINGEVTDIETHAPPNFYNSKDSSNHHDLDDNIKAKNTDDELNNSINNVENNRKNLKFPPVITVADTHHLQLIGKLPLEAKSQLSVGRHVNFTVYDLHSEFTGQISHIDIDKESNNLIVRAPLVSGENNDAVLEPGMDASMRIEYGQMQRGVRVPKEAIHEANLSGLSEKHPRPTTPIKGYVWIIGPDKKLAYDEVEIVQFFADSGKYLVSGIDVDSLVCLADLPKDSVGKTISVK